MIILSLVRASAKPPSASATGRAALGFVTDVRRMNVALTRARRALWVLGNAASLRASPQWASLLDDAEQRGVLIEGASAAWLDAIVESRRSAAAAAARGGPPPGPTAGMGFAQPTKPIHCIDELPEARKRRAAHSTLAVSSHRYN